MPPYTLGPAESSVTRRVAALLAQLLVAAIYCFAAAALPPNLLFVLIVPSSCA